MGQVRFFCFQRWTVFFGGVILVGRSRSFRLVKIICGSFGCAPFITVQPVFFSMGQQQRVVLTLSEMLSNREVCACGFSQILVTEVLSWAWRGGTVLVAVALKYAILHLSDPFVITRKGTVMTIVEASVFSGVVVF